MKIIMNNLKIIILFLAISLSAGNICYGEYAGEGMQTITISGTVDSIDWVGSVMMVNSMRFIVMPDTKIYKGSITIQFSDIEINDAVDVTYYRDSSGALRATSIIVHYSGDFPI